MTNLLVEEELLWPQCPHCRERHDVAACTLVGGLGCDCCLALEDAGVIL